MWPVPARLGGVGGIALATAALDPNCHRRRALKTSARKPANASTPPGLALLSEVTGRRVVGTDGRTIGRLADLSVDLDVRAGPPRVQRLLVRRRRASALLLPWGVIKSVGAGGISLRAGVDVTAFEIACADAALRRHEILIVRDVLDTQIVDVVGRRLARVADVALTAVAGDRLELIGVEVGFGAVLRRLGLPWLAARAPRDVVEWNDLHLTSDRGHTVQLATPRSAVHHLDSAGLAAVVERLDTESAAEVLATTAPAVAAGVIRADPGVGERVLRAMPSSNATDIVAEMPAEHAARWHARLAGTPAFRGRRFLRSRVWPRRRHRRIGPTT